MINVLLAGQLTWNTPILIGCLLIVIFYFRMVIKYKEAHSPPYTQILLFTLGIALLYFSIGSPLLAISYLSFSLHMIQMSLLFFIIPPLILLGIPHFLQNSFINNKTIKWIKRGWLYPQSALISFAILFFLYHLPFTLTIFSNFPSAQTGYLALLFMLSLLMWSPIAMPTPKNRLSILKKKQFAFMSGLLITPACLIFIVSALLDNVNNPFLSQMLAHYCLPLDGSTPTLLPPPFNTKYDQMMAGVLMLGLHKFSIMFTKNLSDHYE